MKKPLVTRARSAARKIVRRAGIVGRPAGLVLLYHRVVALESDPQRLAVTPSRFAQHLEVLQQCYHPMALGELASRARNGTLPDRAVSLTFDDGYADVFENARPFLARFDVAATAFLTTSYLGSGREFWWDELERLVLMPGRLPERLRVRIAGTAHEWDLGSACSYGLDQSRLHANWNVEHSTDPTPRHDLYRRLYRLLRAASSEARDAALGELAEAAAETVSSRATHRALTPDEVVRLTEGSLVAVGAHTVTHPMLSALPPAAQQSEIVESRARLQEITGREVADFAYPFGGRSDYTAATVGSVEKAGFTSACSTTAGRVGPRSDRFRLPRMAVGNWDVDTFHDALRAWL